MTARIPNTALAAGTPPGPPPARPGGEPYRYEMIYDAGSWRGYADTAAELTALLIDGYADLAPEAALQARIRYATDVHVPLQAAEAAAGDLASCTDQQRAVLLGTRDQPPAVAEWTAPVPLVLVTSFYRPDGPLPRPAPAGAAEIIWIDPSGEAELLRSLHRAGWITLASRDGGVDG